MFVLPLPRHRFRVGRAAGCDLQLPDCDRRLSREHFILEQRASGLVIKDSSTNGTWCNDLPLNGGSRTLRAGDQVRAGSWEMLVDPMTQDSKAEIAEGESSDSTRRLKCPSQGRRAEKAGFCSMLGSSTAMSAVYSLVRRLANFDVPVLIQGESGTGKELVAQALHSCSSRNGSPLVALNCAAIQASTAASALFGHEKGAFTGAAQRHAGVFEQASGGTLLLDEIAELSAELQAALLRVLETRTVRPLGATRARPVSFRLVAATHRNLPAEVRAGRFREDLFYRVGVTCVHLPPLRDRGDDVATLARHFLAQHARGDIPELAPGALLHLQEYPWPGNVRELRNAMLRALVLNDSGPIEARHFDLSRETGRTTAATSFAVQQHGERLPHATIPPARPSPDQQRADLVEALQRCRGNRSRAATLLGISRSTLYTRLKTLEMQGEPS